MFRKASLVLLLLVAASLLLIACGGGTASQPPAETKVAEATATPECVKPFGHGSGRNVVR